MANFIWNRDIEEAYANPYEYEAQEQFAREADTMLSKVNEILIDDKYIFHRDDRSLDKALFMLHVDSIESLRECLVLLNEKRHSVAARLLRDVFENVSLCNYFYFDESSKNDLNRWFNDKVISNSTCRNSIESRLGTDKKKAWAAKYKRLSKITHRTYRTLAFSYVLGAGNTIRYEGRSENKFLVLPHTISMYYALLSELILFELNEISDNQVINSEIIYKIIDESYEKDEVERRFANIFLY